MSEKKKASPEEEYFAQQELEKIKRLRSQLDQERAKKAKESCELECWMRCPKCCGNLEEKDLDGLVKVDVCPQCGGLFLDSGELEIIINAHAGLFSHLIHRYRKTYNK